MSDDLPGHANVSVKKGPIWPGGLIEVRLQLEGERLRIEAHPQELGFAKRGAVKRLLGEAAVDELKAGRPAVLEFGVGEAKLSFSNAPGRRASILVELEGRPQFAINFLDFSAVEEATGRPVKTLKRTGEALARSGSARQAREAWREALERAGARS